MTDTINRVVLGKRLRKKIREACGLENLTREERKQRAREIIANYDLKQNICLQYTGITHKDIDRVMKAALDHKNETEESKERKEVPEKWGDENPRGNFKLSNKKVKYRAPTREEVAALIAASNRPIEREPQREYIPPKNTWTREEVAALIRGDYRPDKFKYLKK